MSDLAGRHIVLFMTRGVTLDDWRRIGMLDRELALYRRLVAAGAKVSIVSGGGVTDAAMSERLAPIRVCCNDRGLPNRLYRVLLPILHRETFASCDVVKTNQADGGLLALRVARRFGKPLVARCGYMWSLNHTRRYGPRDRRTRRALRVERVLFRGATLAQVTTDAMRDELDDRLGEAVKQRVRVVPNFVDTDLFCPHPGITPGADVVFVGRFGLEKNLAALLEAVRDLPIRLHMIGGGGGATPQQLMPHVAGGRVEVAWLGQVPHQQLADALCRAKVFVLPSLYEGHPKALLEAMACGLPVVVTDRPGLREVVRHGQTGYVCDVTAASIRDAIIKLLSDEALRHRMGAAARDEVLRRYALDCIVSQETRVLTEAIALGRPARD